MMYDQIALSTQRRLSDRISFFLAVLIAPSFFFFFRASPVSIRSLKRVHVSLAAHGRLRGEQMPVRNGSELVPLLLCGLQVRGRTFDLIRSGLLVKTNEDGDGSSGRRNENEGGRREIGRSNRRDSDSWGAERNNDSSFGWMDARAMGETHDTTGFLGCRRHGQSRSRSFKLLTRVRINYSYYVFPVERRMRK